MRTEKRQKPSIAGLLPFFDIPPFGPQRPEKGFLAGSEILGIRASRAHRSMVKNGSSGFRVVFRGSEWTGSPQLELFNGFSWRATRVHIATVSGVRDEGL